MIPKSNHLDVIFGQAPAPDTILLHFLWLTMLEAIQFHRQFRRGTIEIQNAVTEHILSAKFETCKLPRSQRLPKLLFFFRLFLAKFAGDSL